MIQGRDTETMGSTLGWHVARTRGHLVAQGRDRGVGTGLSGPEQGDGGSLGQGGVSRVPMCHCPHSTTMTRTPASRSRKPSRRTSSTRPTAPTVSVSGTGMCVSPGGGAATPVGVCGLATGVTPGCAHRRDRAARGADRRLQEQHRPLLLRHRQLPRERGGWRHPGVVVGDTARGARAGEDTQGWWVGDTRVAGWGRGGITGQGGGYLAVPGQGTQRGCAERSQDREGTQKVPPSRGGGGSTSGCPHLAVPPRDPVVPQLMLTAVLNCLFDSLSQMLRYDGSWGGTEAPGGHPLS